MELTPQQAINILDQASAIASLTRVQHIQVSEALNVLRKLHPEEKKEAHVNPA